jgi:hypothetical protein
MSRQIRNTLRCTAALLTIAALMAPAALATRYVAGPSAAATGTTGATAAIRTGGFAWADAGLGFAVACGGMLTALGLVRMGRHLHVRPEGRAA